MGLLIANDNLLTALGITNKEQFDQTFADFSEFETFVEKCGYEYDFDEEGNLILITPKSKEINTGINGFKPDKNYFAITALEAGTINMDKSGKELYWSTDGRTWTLSSTSESTISVEVNTGTNLYLKGSNTTYKYSNSSGAFTTSTCNYNVSGNIMSLFYDEDFEDKVSFPGNNKDIFSRFFLNDTHLINAKDLLLPATTLTDYCYNYMFGYCRNLVTAPELPATTLPTYGCYTNMFIYCTSLVTAPELPATTLAQFSYNGMFTGCTKLNYIKAMFTTTPSSSYTGNWVDGVSPTGTFVKNSAATWNETGNNGIPTGWTVETADS